MSENVDRRYADRLQSDPPEGYEVEFHESIPSTSDRARDLARDRDGVVVVAGEQTDGRGRRDRTWQSPGGGVYLSAVAAPPGHPATYPLTTLAAGVAVVDAVRERGAAVDLNWPNDVLADGRKLSGVLTERVDDRVVVGVGINVDSHPSLPDRAVALADLVDADADSDAAAGSESGSVDRAALVRDLLDRFDDVRTDPETIRSAWRRRAGTLCRRVRVETPGGTVRGEAVDVDDRGALVVATDDGEVTVDAGDCEHLRPADD